MVGGEGTRTCQDFPSLLLSEEAAVTSKAALHMNGEMEQCSTKIRAPGLSGRALKGS